MPQLTRITRDPAVMGGKPCIRGMRVYVGTVVGLQKLTKVSSGPSSAKPPNSVHPAGTVIANGTPKPSAT